MLCPVQRARNRFMMLHQLANWAVNVLAVTALPARIGQLGGPSWFFLAYAVLAGTILTLVEDVRYARSIFSRSDVRDYLGARIAIIVVCGMVPFLLGGAFAW